MQKILMRPISILIVLLSAISVNAHAYDPMGYTWSFGRAQVTYRITPGEYSKAIDATMRDWETGTGFQFVSAFPRGISSLCPILDSDYVNTITVGYSPCSTLTVLPAENDASPRSSKDANIRSALSGVDWGDAIAFTYALRRNTSFVNATIVMNANTNWAVYDGNLRSGTYDFKRVVLHELGHFAGLNHEHRLPSIMAPKISNRYQLQNDDRLGIRSLYPKVLSGSH